MYIVIAPGGIIGFDWILLGLGFFADMAGYFGSYCHRESVPYGDQNSLGWVHIDPQR